jgi:hypothetical protein
MTLGAKWRNAARRKALMAETNEKARHVHELVLLRRVLRVLYRYVSLQLASSGKYKARQSRIGIHVVAAWVAQVKRAKVVYRFVFVSCD